MAETRKRTSMSVPEMGRMLGLCKTESYWLIMVDDFGAIAFGCPAMGAEVLEEDEFEPMFSDCQSKLSGKRIALFGSYGWGDGEWMRSWEDTCRGAGAVLACDSVICQDAPDDDGKADCRSLGAALA